MRRRVVLLCSLGGQSVSPSRRDSCRRFAESPVGERPLSNSDSLLTVHVAERRPRDTRLDEHWHQRRRGVRACSWRFMRGGLRFFSARRRVKRSHAGLDGRLLRRGTLFVFLCGDGPLLWHACNHQARWWLDHRRLRDARRWWRCDRFGPLGDGDGWRANQIGLGCNRGRSLRRVRDREHPHRSTDERCDDEDSDQHEPKLTLGPRRQFQRSE